MQTTRKHIIPDAEIKYLFEFKFVTWHLTALIVPPYFCF